MGRLWESLLRLALAAGKALVFWRLVERDFLVEVRCKSIKRMFVIAIMRVAVVRLAVLLDCEFAGISGLDLVVGLFVVVAAAGIVIVVVVVLVVVVAVGVVVVLMV